jgi:transcriptional regulator NrdR family protein
MDCPRCHAATVVLEKREGDRRRRECSSPECLFRFTTYEVTSQELEGLRAAKHQVERMRDALMQPDDPETRPGALGELDLPL